MLLLTCIDKVILFIETFSVVNCGIFFLKHFVLISDPLNHNILQLSVISLRNKLYYCSAQVQSRNI